MAVHIKYSGDTFRVPDAYLAGNSTDGNPLEFDIVPAWGGDVARIRSITHASMGITQEQEWSPATQAAVTAAFEHGAPAFANCITKIRGLTIPNLMALRAGLIPAIPPKLDGSGEPDVEGVYAVTSGIAFSRVCGALIALGLYVAMEIGKLTGQAERDLDARFFGQPSGSGGTGTAQKARVTSATTAKRRRGARGTAGSL